MEILLIYSEICGFLKEKFNNIIERFEINMEIGKTEDIIVIKVKKH